MTMNITLTEAGSLVLWPDLLERLAFGPGLTLEEVADLEDLIAEATPMAAAWIAAEAAAAQVTDLGEYRTNRRGRSAQRPDTERGAR